MAVYLCCTGPEVAFGGRYPLSLPYGVRTFLVSGLSAHHTRLPGLLTATYYGICSLMSNFIAWLDTVCYNAGKDYSEA